MKKGTYKHTDEIKKHLSEARLNFYKNGGVPYFKGKKRPPMSKEQKLKISDAHKGKVVSEETRRKIGLANKGDKSYFFGKHMSGENHPNWKGGFDQQFFNRKRRNMKKNATGSHTEIEWQELKKKFNYMCLCCKHFEPEIKLTRDHIIPLKFGGADFITNIQPLCLSCNCKKHTKSTSYILSPIQVI